MKRVIIKMMILKNLKEKKVLTTGVLPHFRTRARLILTEVKEVNSNMKYLIFDVKLSSKVREERSTDFGPFRPFSPGPAIMYKMAV